MDMDNTRYTWQQYIKCKPEEHEQYIMLHNDLGDRSEQQQIGMRYIHGEEFNINS